MTNVVFALLNPLAVLVIFSICAWFFLGRKRTQAFVWILVLGLFFSLPYPIHQLIQLRESESLPLDSSSVSKSQHCNVVVLGAGKNDDVRLWANQRLSLQALGRLVEGVKWMHRLPNAKLVVSGPVGKGDISQARHMAEAAKLMGVAAGRISLQENVYNTHTEAEQYVKHQGTKAPLILCTSALHMKRAVLWFEAYGVEKVFAAPSSFLVPREPVTWKSWIPQFDSFGKWQQYLKEVLGEKLVKEPIMAGARQYD